MKRILEIELTTEAMEKNEAGVICNPIVEVAAEICALLLMSHREDAVDLAHFITDEFLPESITENFVGLVTGLVLKYSK